MFRSLKALRKLNIDILYITFNLHTLKTLREPDKHIQVFQLRLSPRQSGKVEYARLTNSALIC